MNTAMTYAHSHEAVTTYTAFLESDELPTSTGIDVQHLPSQGKSKENALKIPG
jgi:hypothetical protein